MPISNENLKTYSKAEIFSLTTVRKGETKLGEVIESYISENTLTQYKNKGFQYVVLGIPESVGALANGGRSGAENAWKAFLSFFFNVQHNRFMDASKILLLGSVKVSAIQETRIGGAEEETILRAVRSHTAMRHGTTVPQRLLGQP